MSETRAVCRGYFKCREFYALRCIANNVNKTIINGCSCTGDTLIFGRDSYGEVNPKLLD